MSTAAQKKAIKEFRSVTGATEKVATDVLKKQNWNLERSIDSFFNNRGSFPASSDKKVDTSKLSKVFDKYAGTTEKKKDIIEDEKLMEYLNAIGVDPEGGGSLTIAYKLKCKTIGFIRRQEFLDGWGALGADSTDTMKTQAKDIVKILENKLEFKDFYRWLFDFVKDESERKTIDASTAVDMWNLVMLKHFPLLPKWIKFLESQGQKTVSQDLWTMTYEFARDVKSDLSNYDPDGAWPGLVDEFVDYVKADGKKGDD